MPVSEVATKTVKKISEVPPYELCSVYETMKVIKYDPFVQTNMYMTGKY
jgi:hypothetical protein